VERLGYFLFLRGNCRLQGGEGAAAEKGGPRYGVWFSTSLNIFQLVTDHVRSFHIAFYIERIGMAFYDSD